MITLEKQIRCTCGKKANLYHYTHYKVFMIVCECGKRVGADTEKLATEIWNKSDYDVQEVS